MGGLSGSREETLSLRARVSPVVDFSGITRLNYYACKLGALAVDQIADTANLTPRFRRRVFPRSLVKELL